MLAGRPDFTQAEALLGQSLTIRGQLDEAVTRLEHAQRLSPHSSMVAAMLLRAYARRGDTAKANALLKELLIRQHAGGSTPVAIASAYASLGETAQAISWLERAVTERARGLHLVGTSGTFSMLRDDARFKALLARIDLS